MHTRRSVASATIISSNWLIAQCHTHNASQTFIPAAATIVAPAIVSSTHQFNAPVRRLVPTFTDISSSLAPLYVETAMFALRAQQRITNWDSRSAYVFNNATRYLSLVQLHTTASRPFQLHDQLLFLQSGEHPFTPDDPWGTLFAQRHYQYRVTQTSNDVLHCDFVELLYAPAQTDIVLKMRCTYTGTYLLRVINCNANSSSVQPPSASVQHLPHELSAPSSTSAAALNPSHHSQVVGRGSLSNIFRPLQSRQAPLMPPMQNRSVLIDSLRPRDDDADSDDSRQASVKRLKDSQVEVEGKTYRVQGKTSVYTIIIAFTSMCTLMEDGHIEKLLAGFGNYVNSYTLKEFFVRHLFLQNCLVCNCIPLKTLHYCGSNNLFGLDSHSCMTKFFKSNGLIRIHGHQTTFILFTFFPSTTQLVRIFTSITKAGPCHGLGYA